MSNILAKMKKLQRSAPGMPEVRIRLSETGTVHVDVMRTADQANADVVERLKAKDRDNITLDELVALVAAEKALPRLTATAKEPENAIAAILARLTDFDSNDEG